MAFLLCELTCFASLFCELGTPMFLLEMQNRTTAAIF